MKFTLVDNRPKYNGVQIFADNAGVPIAYSCPASASRHVAHQLIDDKWVTTNDFKSSDDAADFLRDFYKCEVE
jgi:hypothetical protein